MQKNYLFLNLMVLLISMTFGGFALQPSMAAAGYTPTVTEDEITVFLETSFDNAKVWAWNDNPQLTTAGWPGDAMTLMGKASNGKNIFKWTYTGDKGAPTAIIFTHDGGQKLNGGDQEYVNHGYYVEGAYAKTIEVGAGKVMVFFDNTTHDLADVFCFIYNGTTAAEQWPGLKMTYDAKASFNGKTGFFTVEVPDNFLTGSFVINNGKDGSTLQGQTVYVGGTTTAIENMTMEETKNTADDAWYTITGMRTNKPTQAGLYIHNGKKVIIR